MENKEILKSKENKVTEIDQKDELIKPKDQKELVDEENTDDFVQNPPTEKEIREAKKVRNLVIFTSDIDSSHVKTPYTNEYCLRFLQIIFDGIGLLKQDHDAPSYNVCLLYTSPSPRD